MEEKTCVDCLHCKVSKKSSENSRLCFCMESKEKVRHKETYWLNKQPCDHFVDMCEEPLTVVVLQNEELPKTTSAVALNKRPPLLKEKVYEHF